VLRLTVCFFFFSLFSFSFNEGHRYTMTEKDERRLMTDAIMGYREMDFLFFFLGTKTNISVYEYEKRHDI